MRLVIILFLVHALGQFHLFPTVAQTVKPVDPSIAPINAYDRPNGQMHQSRSVVYARDGMACTSDVRATQAAIEILRAGGSAVDAAIAANAVLGVVEPMNCGVGGDLFAIVWDANSQRLHGLNASGRSPRQLSLQELRKRELKQIPITGPLSWSVPGCVSGWSDLHGRFGKIAWPQLFESAIAYADGGVAVGEISSGEWKNAETKLAPFPDAARTFLIDSKTAPAPGDVFRNPNLAKTYRRLATQGADVFYKGPIAETIVTFSQANGGFFSIEDFTSHRNSWIDPVSTNYRGYEVWELPPNGQGIAALQILNILENFNIAHMGWGSAEYLHLFTEAKKLAFADRARYYADMDFADVPVAQLISKSYARSQVSRIDAKKAAVSVPQGDPKLRSGDTVYLCVVDKDRNCCSLIQSNYFDFGSGMVPADLGFAIQNRGSLFAIDDQHSNRFEPGKRPFHTIIPAMVTRDGKPYFIFGVMGGDMQPQGHVQVLVNHIDFGMNIQMAGDASRVRHEGSQTPTGLPMDENGGTLNYESGIPAATIERLQSMGHKTNPSHSSFGGYQGILIDWNRGILQGATESRKDGTALGFDR